MPAFEDYQKANWRASSLQKRQRLRFDVPGPRGSVTTRSGRRPHRSNTTNPSAGEEPRDCRDLPKMKRPARIRRTEDVATGSLHRVRDAGSAWAQRGCRGPALPPFQLQIPDNSPQTESQTALKEPELPSRPTRCCELRTEHGGFSALKHSVILIGLRLRLTAFGTVPWTDEPASTPDK